MSAPPRFGTAAGGRLWALLPQVYRTRDLEVGGDLAALVDAFGEVLETIRGTLDQRLAEVAPGARHPAYPEPGEPVRRAQDWVLPYFADLLGARLVSPHEEGRRRELQRATAWRKAKGTVTVAESAGEVVAGVEVEVREGRLTIALTPRVDRPLLPPAVHGVDVEADPWQPNLAATHPGLPTVTPDLRLRSRPVAAARTDPRARRRQAPAPLDLGRRLEAVPGVDAATGERLVARYSPNELLGVIRDDDVAALSRVAGVDRETAETVVARLHGLLADVVWRVADPRGVPCVLGSHADRVPRTPDVRRPDALGGRHHPRRLVVFHAPPTGFFPPPERGDRRSAPEDVVVPPESRGLRRQKARLGDVTLRSPGRHEIRDAVVGSLTVEAGTVLLRDVTLRGPLVLLGRGAHRLTGVVQLGDAPTVRVGPGARLEAVRCALGDVDADAEAEGTVDENDDTVLPGPLGADDVVVCVDTLLRSVTATGRVTLDACTVLRDSAVGWLRASEAVLVANLQLTGDARLDTCLRFSRVPPLQPPADARVARFHTTSRPVLLTRDPTPGADATVPASYGRPGCGVLADTCPSVITSGAEDGGEMGCYHHRAHVAARTALVTKLSELLPVGIEPALVADPSLHTRPPAPAGPGGTT